MGIKNKESFLYAIRNVMGGEILTTVYYPVYRGRGSDAIKGSSAFKAGIKLHTNPARGGMNYEDWEKRIDKWILIGEDEIRVCMPGSIPLEFHVDPNHEASVDLTLKRANVRIHKFGEVSINVAKKTAELDEGIRDRRPGLDRLEALAQIFGYKVVRSVSLGEYQKASKCLGIPEQELRERVTKDPGTIELLEKILYP
jgi:hypothetical protein